MTTNKAKLHPSVTLNFLRSHSLFGGIIDIELEKIRDLLIEKHFPEASDIIREGEAGGDLYLIWKGSVEVLKEDPEAPDTAPVRLAILDEGESFGDMELIDIQPSVATVRAREETITLILTNGDLYSIERSNLQTFTMIIMNLAREISRRLRVMDIAAAHASFKRT
jgi:CRP/FNR family transcriptional regulator, cyclic AMP receptor protein